MKTAQKKILRYLDEYGSVNTFRLSRKLGIDRVELIDIIKELTKKGLTEFRSGIVLNVKKGLEEGQRIKSKEVASPVPKTGKVKRKKERKEVEKDLKEREKSLMRREEIVKKREESVSAAFKKLKKDKELLDKEREGIIKTVVEVTGLEKEKEKIAKTRNKLRREKEQISKAKILKENINGLESNLEGLKKKVNIEKKKLKRLKGTKPKVITKGTKSPFSKSKTKKRKPTLKPEIERPIEKTGFSITETEQSEIMPKDRWQPDIEIGEEKIEDKFHELIEQERNLLKEKRINEAREIHLQIKDMINEVTNPDQRKIIIRDWNRVRDFY